MMAVTMAPTIYAPTCLLVSDVEIDGGGCPPPVSNSTICLLGVAFLGVRRVDAGGDDGRSQQHADERRPSHYPMPPNAMRALSKADSGMRA
jgi:hypothetical protein